MLGTALLMVAAILLSVWWWRTTADHKRADELMAAAQQHAEQGQFAAAITHVNQALELRNDATTRARLEVYHAENRRIATEAAWKVAESKQLLEHDRGRSPAARARRRTTGIVGQNALGGARRAGQRLVVAPIAVAERQARARGTLVEGRSPDRHRRFSGFAAVLRQRQPA